jgi:outer membrane PBP1 activator LpoA protein
VQGKEARKQLDAAQKALEKMSPCTARATRLYEAQAEAVQERDASFDTVVKRLQQLSPDEPIMQEINSAERIQRLVSANKCPGNTCRASLLCQL